MPHLVCSPNLHRRQILAHRLREKQSRKNERQHTKILDIENSRKGKMNTGKFFIKILFFVIVFLSLGACATTLRVEKALDVETKKQLQISEVLVTADSYVFTSDTLLRALKSAVLSQLNAVKAQGIPAVMEIVVTRAKIVTRGRRALMGAFGGSNILDITATIKAAETKNILGIYEVKGKYNPGGWGVFSDPIESTTSSVAEELVKGIYQ